MFRLQLNFGRFRLIYITSNIPIYFCIQIVLLPNVNKLDLFKGRDADAYQRKQLYEKYNCKQYYVKANIANTAPEVCKKLQFSISSMIHNGGLSCNCDPVGTMSNGSSVLTCKEAGGQCPCKPGVVGRTCNKCAPGYFGYGRNGCTGLYFICTY